uniref:Glycerophosphodiester phosphodiesterase domain-containing protein 5-like isoform X2 n=1 Tax=Crassostrea virginica TaxID=6565 RepID=A0A8B8ER35_CRAVI|nr:glycerophosphodiester phosphodiesterase domain-containing protein 5-like isoform X2 [Crassostrea virginica]
MVSHMRLQYYRHKYCLVCMTGSLGCRWHRYKQSTRDSRKRDLIGFAFLLITFLFYVFLLYCILMMKNDFITLNWFFFDKTGKWLPIYTIFLAVVCVIFVYLFILLCLCLCHLLVGHQLYIHKVHTGLMVLFMGFCVAMVVAIEEMWSQEWAVVWLSLKIFGPYLQVGAVSLMTLMSWLIARQWFTLSSTYWQFFGLLFYLAVMTGLYIAPLFIKSPCVINIKQLPPKPKLMAHRGASAIAPENTLASFHRANEFNVQGFETDIRISLDGVPFILHDSTFLRTTNIEKVFPSLKSEDASNFNMSQIKQLNAGLWFMEEDPMSTIDDISLERQLVYSNQSIPTLTELLEYMKSSNKSLMFDIREPPEDHPYRDSIINQTIEAIQQSQVRPEYIWWLTEALETAPANFTSVAAKQYYPSDVMQNNSVSRLNVMFNVLSSDNILEYNSNNISVNIYLVNENWLFSLYWCMGVPSVTTDNCHTLSALQTPIFHLSPRNYLILWITVDIMSALLVITAFIVQRILWSGSEYSPERVAINSSASVNDHGSHKMSRSSHRQNRRQMKEKLILKDIVSDFFDEDSETHEDDYGIESNYTVQSTDGLEMARSFQRASAYSKDFQRQGITSTGSFQGTSGYQKSHDGQGVRNSFQRASGYQSEADSQGSSLSHPGTSGYQSSLDGQGVRNSFQRASGYQSEANGQGTSLSLQGTSGYQSSLDEQGARNSFQRASGYQSEANCQGTSLSLQGTSGYQSSLDEQGARNSFQRASGYQSEADGQGTSLSLQDTSGYQNCPDGQKTAGSFQRASVSGYQSDVDVKEVKEIPDSFKKLPGPKSSIDGNLEISSQVP